MAIELTVDHVRRKVDEIFRSESRRILATRLAAHSIDWLSDQIDLLRTEVAVIGVQTGQVRIRSLDDVVGLADAQDRHLGERRGRANFLADVERGPLTRDDVDDRELVVGDLAERLARVGGGRDGVADGGQSGADRLGRRRVGVDEQDRAGGQAASPGAAV